VASAFQSKKIYPEKTLGERLRGLRKRRHLSLDQAEEVTKVRRRFLEALEKGDYAALPADVYTMGFLVKYAEFLKAPKEELLEDYRRERVRDIPSRMFSPQKELKEKRFIITPRLMVFGLVLSVFLGLIGYVVYSVKNFTSPPALEISSPVEETVIRQDQVEVIGKTDEGATLQINDQTVYLDANGNFKETVKLQPGINNIELKATNRIKKQTVKTIKILAEF